MAVMICFIVFGTSFGISKKGSHERNSKCGIFWDGMFDIHVFQLEETYSNMKLTFRTSREDQFFGYVGMMYRR